MKEPELSIGILETGRPPDNMADTFGDYPTMIADWLAGPGTEFESFPILDGGFPGSPSDCDLWAVTGSSAGVYENHGWIPPLEDFIRRCRDVNQPMVGICFGHQIIAQALGGKVRRSSRGWGLGVTRYPVTHWPRLLGPAPGALDLPACHRDQIEEPPEDAQVVSGTEFCPNAALWYPDFALTVQGHPEFSSGYLAALLQDLRKELISDEEAECALETLSRPTSAEILAKVIRSHPNSLNRRIGTDE